MRARSRADLGWLALVGVLLLLGAWWLPGRGGDRRDSFSVAFDGKRAFHDLLGELHPSVTRSRLPIRDAIEKHDTLLILGPPRAPSAAEWDALHAWVRGGGSLLFAARGDTARLELGPFQGVVRGVKSWSARGDVEDRPVSTGSLDAEDPTDDEEDPDWFEDFGSVDDEDLDSGWDELTSDRTISTRKLSGPLVEGVTARRYRWGSRARLVDCGDAEVLLEVPGAVQAVRQRVGRGIFVLVASDEVFSNREIARVKSESFRLAFDLFASVLPGRSVAVDEFLNESGVPRVFGVLFHPSLRKITLQACVLLVLFAWSRSRRFGPVAPPEEAPRRSLREHALALGNLHFKAGNGRTSLEHYTDHFAREIGVATLGVSILASESARGELTNRLSRWAGVPSSEIEPVLRSVGEALAASHVSNADAAALIRSLARIHERLQFARESREELKR